MNEREAPSNDIRSIFDTFYRPLVSYANNYIPLKSDCEDIVQEVFIGIWERKTVFPNQTALKNYLYKATRNKCYDNIKHKKVKETYAKDVLHHLQNDDLFMKQVLEEEITRKLHMAIETLPERKREIIRLSLGNLKNKDIAERLNVKLQTVKTLKSQAYKILRAKFKDMGNVIIYLLFPMNK
ncbi:MAG: RNA polymerase sigma-70 factor [Flavobacteriaceae bacterium]